MPRSYYFVLQIRNSRYAYLNIKLNLSLFSQFLGKGSFGVVIRGFWRGQDVAVKIFHKDSEQEAFKVRTYLLIV